MLTPTSLIIKPCNIHSTQYNTKLTSIIPSMASPLFLAIPFPGRGHINPMLSLCRLIAARRPDARVLVVVTEEWLTLLGPKSPEAADNVSFAAIPNVVPSELVRGSDHAGFLEAVLRDMEGPVERLLEGLAAAPDVVVADTFLPWAVALGRRRGAVVASFWPMSALAFSVFYHHDLVVGSGHCPLDLSEGGKQEISSIPGVPPIRLSDLPGIYYPNNRRTLNVVIESMSMVSQAQILLFRTIADLEEPTLRAIEAQLPIPIYPIGPAISNITTSTPKPGYIEWLDRQPPSSVLYVSLGSYISTSSAQLDELTAGLKASGAAFLWVARDQTARLSAALGKGGSMYSPGELSDTKAFLPEIYIKDLPAALEESGLVVGWCDQVRVLNHPSVGGFLTHCGWNSTLEAAFAGVPALTFPIGADQPLDGKMMVDEWGVGWRLKGGDRFEMAKREEISELVRRFMDLDSSDRKELQKRSKELRDRLKGQVAEDGSTSGFDMFLSRVLRK